MGYDFGAFEKDAITLPRNLAWSNWFKFEKVGDKVQGFIRDVFYKKADGLFKEARGITLEQQDGGLVNVSVKRLPFVLSEINHLRLGDPLTIVFFQEIPSATKGFHPIKNLKFYGTNLPETVGNKTMAELEAADMAAQKVEADSPDELEEMATAAANLPA